MAMSLIFLLSADPNTIYGCTPKETPLYFSRNRSGVWQNWLWAYKSGNISETQQDRAKVAINGLYKFVYALSIAAKMG